jgi:DNA invertase Pin-like site-specific DNA recombinase
MSGNLMDLNLTVEGDITMMMAAKGGKRVAYIRVSSVDQNEARQVEGMVDQHIDKTFMDKASGKDVKRPQLQAALEYLRDGDVLVCHSMDRLGRNLRDLQNLIAELNARHVAVEFVKERLAFTGEDSPMANLMLALLGGVAEFERALIRERQREGIAVAKSKGTYRGRKRSLTADQAADICKRADAGERKSDLAREFSISRETVYQYLALRGESTPGRAKIAPPATNAVWVPDADGRLIRTERAR